MAGVLEQIRRPRRQLVRVNASAIKTDQKALELRAAMEILSEVFGTDMYEIDMMLKQHYEEGAYRLQGSNRRADKRQSLLKHRCNEVGEWQSVFCLAE